MFEVTIVRDVRRRPRAAAITGKCENVHATTTAAQVTLEGAELDHNRVAGGFRE